MKQKKQEKRERILFTCVGMSDPVRGQRDGPLMHIARHFRPSAICIFISKEAQKNISYYQKMIDFMRDKWKYEPAVSMIPKEIEDPSNLDGLYIPMRDAFENFINQYPNAEIFINLTSGTSQMEIILSQFAASPQYRAIGVQVKNPERKAGTTERVNSKRYNPDEELEHNLDESPESYVNRCVRPKLFTIKQEQEWHTVRGLLERGDYAAILQRNQEVPCLSPVSAKIIEHLNARDSLKDDDARKIAQELPPDVAQDLNLYPMKTDEPDPANYWEIVNYWLMMKNLIRNQHFSAFILRLSVLTLYLEEAMIRVLLAKRGVHYDNLLIRSDKYDDLVLSMSKLLEKAPDVYDALRAKMAKNNWEGKSEPRDERNVFLYTLILKCMNTPKDAMRVFNTCDNLTGERNDLAHRLKSVSREEMEKTIDRKTDTFIRQTERAIVTACPSCDPAVFAVHDRCAAYIETHR